MTTMSKKMFAARFLAQSGLSMCNVATVIGTIKANCNDYNDFNVCNAQFNFNMTCICAQEAVPLILYYLL